MAAYTVCPKCHFHEPSARACSHCGTVFEKWYDNKEHAPEIVEQEMERFRAQVRRTRQSQRRRWLILRAAVLLAIVSGIVILFARVVRILP